MAHVTIVELKAVTLEWLRVTLVVKRAHISSKRRKQSQAELQIPWLSFLCGLVSKENQSFLKKAQIILKVHFSLSFKMKTLRSAASSSLQMGQTHSQQSLPSQRKAAEGNHRERKLSDMLRFPQACSTRNHSKLHMAHHRHSLSGLTALKTSPCSMQPVGLHCDRGSLKA